ncbi:TetR/AcrR family transcriptional regulator [Thermosediminibacter litoriperuensis]|uniref:TetR family transcriptional regulator n=1 Tax=Thermosediminibacter litoriperuensis TaxID=291989 RepID=A0A5S5ASP6_9FIRM|nr:TetR/AcrR family transcriptional regulator [Thermosediminibacter litoriperuensis]TYP55445.1 TetR family transcriptional regulator [Thermosediminibacter litoriperuensis]
MPKSTFFNLPADKREKILQVAIEEFARHSYREASVNRIVERSGIAKGSFYQYFEDKKDLFKFIIEKSGEKKLEYLGQVLNNLEQLDFFELVRELYAAGIKFAKENPELFAIGQRLLKDDDRNLFEEIMEDPKNKGQQFFVELLKKGIQRGEIDPGISVELVAMLLVWMNFAISEYFLNEKKKNDLMGLMEIVDELIYVIKNGIKAKGRTENADR